MSNPENIFDFEAGLVQWSKDNPEFPVNIHAKLFGPGGNSLGTGIVIRAVWDRCWDEYLHDVLLDDGTTFTGISGWYLERVTGPRIKVMK